MATTAKRAIISVARDGGPAQVKRGGLGARVFNKHLNRRCAQSWSRFPRLRAKTSAIPGTRLRWRRSWKTRSTAGASVIPHSDICAAWAGPARSLNPAPVRRGDWDSRRAGRCASITRRRATRASLHPTYILVRTRRISWRRRPAETEARAWLRQTAKTLRGTGGQGRALHALATQIAAGRCGGGGRRGWRSRSRGGEGKVGDVCVDKAAEFYG